MFEVDKTYTTKFATQETFTIKRIIVDKEGRPRVFWGIYEKSSHLGECPLNSDRLIDPDEVKELKFCEKCKKPLK